MGIIGLGWKDEGVVVPSSHAGALQSCSNPNSCSGAGLPRRLTSMTRLVRLACLVVACAFISGCGDDRYGIAQLRLRHATVIERRASLSALRRAWAARPDTASAEGNLYERSVLNRAAYFGRQVKDTETYRAACDFWMACVREHIARYEDDAHRFKT
jgi:hypothetical protein